RGFEITIDDQRLTVPELDGDSHAYLSWTWKVSRLLSSYAERGVMPEQWRDGEEAANLTKATLQANATAANATDEAKNKWKSAQGLWRILVGVCKGRAATYLQQMGNTEEGNGAYAWWHLRNCYLRNKNQMGTMLAQQLRSFAWQTLEPETEILRFESLVNQYRVCMGEELSQLDQQAYLTDSIPTTETSLSILKENILSENLGLDASKDRLRNWGATHLRQSTTSTSPQQDIMTMMHNKQPPAPPLFPSQGSYPVQPPMPPMAQQMQSSPPQHMPMHHQPTPSYPTYPHIFTQQHHQQPLPHGHLDEQRMRRIGMVDCDFCRKMHWGGWRFCDDRINKLRNGDTRALMWEPRKDRGTNNRNAGNGRQMTNRRNDRGNRGNGGTTQPVTVEQHHIDRDSWCLITQRLITVQPIVSELYSIDLQSSLLVDCGATNSAVRDGKHLVNISPLAVPEMIRTASNDLMPIKAVGTLPLTMQSTSGPVTLMIGNVAVVPDLKYNVLATDDINLHGYGVYLSHKVAPHFIHESTGVSIPLSRCGKLHFINFVHVGTDMAMHTGRMENGGGQLSPEQHSMGSGAPFKAAPCFEITIDDQRLTVPELDGDSHAYLSWTWKVSRLLSSYAERGVMPEQWRDGEEAANLTKATLQANATAANATDEAKNKWKSAQGLWRILVGVCKGRAATYLQQMGNTEEGNGAYAWWHLRNCYLRNKNQMGTMLAQQLRSFAWQTLEPETEILRFESLVNQYRVCMGEELSQLDQQAYLTDSIPTTETSLSILKENILSENLGLDAIKDRLRNWGATHLRQSTTSTSPQQDTMAMMHNTQPPAPPLFPSQGSYPVQPLMPPMAPQMQSSPSQHMPMHHQPSPSYPTYPHIFTQQHHQQPLPHGHLDEQRMRRIGMVDCNFCHKTHMGGWRFCDDRINKLRNGDSRALMWEPRKDRGTNNRNAGNGRQMTNRRNDMGNRGNEGTTQPVTVEQHHVDRDSWCLITQRIITVQPIVSELYSIDLQSSMLVDCGATNSAVRDGKHLVNISPLAVPEMIRTASNDLMPIKAVGTLPLTMQSTSGPVTLMIGNVAVVPHLKYNVLATNDINLHGYGVPEPQSRPALYPREHRCEHSPLEV
ncbi:unnamed protein product, partial [Vitrella brassicaformis CCMP3155]